MDKPEKSYYRLRISTIIARTFGIILLLLTVTVAGFIGVGLFQSRDNINEAQFLGYRALIMSDDGMDDVIRPNALVLVKLKGYEIELRDIVAYMPEEEEAPVLSRVWKIDGQQYTVCQDNRSSFTQQIIDNAQILGVVPGDLGIFPRPIGIWNWSAPIVADVRVQLTHNSEDASEAIQNITINWAGASKWGGIILGPVFALVALWVILELMLSKRRKILIELLTQEPEDVYSASLPPPLPPGHAPVIKQTSDGQAIAVFPPVLAPVLGMPDDAPPQQSFPAPPPTPTPLPRPVQAAFPAPVPRPAATVVTEQPPVVPPAVPPAAKASAAAPLPGSSEVITDDEFNEMLRQFEQGFLYGHST